MYFFATCFVDMVSGRLPIKFEMPGTMQIARNSVGLLVNIGDKRYVTKDTSSESCVFVGSNRTTIVFSDETFLEEFLALVADEQAKIEERFSNTLEADFGGVSY